MDNDEDAYFLRRAEAELELARQAADDRARFAHSLLSGLYLDRVYNGCDDLNVGE